MRTIACVLFLATMFAATPAPARYAAQSPKNAAAKFERAFKFGTRRAEMQRALRLQLKRSAADEQTAVAAIATIMDKTNMRVGSEKYAQREEKDVKLPSGLVIHHEPSFGASSLRKDQVAVRGDTVSFTFRGKSHVAWSRAVKDADLARAVKVFLKRPGERLFEIDAGEKTLPVTERNVRAMFASYGAKAKDLRTVQANALLDHELGELPRPHTKKEAEQNLDAAIRNVASQMGHTTAVCRSSYLDPRKLSAYTKGLR